MANERPPILTMRVLARLEAGPMSVPGLMVALREDREKLGVTLRRLRRQGDVSASKRPHPRPVTYSLTAKGRRFLNSVRAAAAVHHSSSLPTESDDG